MGYKNYVLLLGADQYLRERALAGIRELTPYPIWTASVEAKYKKNRYFDYNLEANPQDEISLLEAIERQELKGWSPKAIIPLNDWTLKVAHKLNKKLGLTSMPEKVIELSRNKDIMKNAFLENGLPTAPFRLINNEKELLLASEEVGYPAIIKPFDFGGSGGVYLANHISEAMECLKKSKKVVSKYANDFGIDGSSFIFEKYIKSEEEISIEVVCYDGEYKVLAVTEKYLTPEPRFAEIGHLVPSHRTEDENLKEIACKACDSLGITMGLAHVELKIQNNKPWIIEVGARPAGDGIMDLIERVFDINPYKLHAASYLNINPFEFFSTSLEPNGTAAIAFLKAEPGVISNIKQPINLPEEVESLWIHAQIGNFSEEGKCWKDREGVIELFWDQTFDYKPTQPILISEYLSSEIFTVKEVVKYHD
ncbi:MULTISPECIES: ATP-grasp domain-containing protein [Clostridia]|uniref:ATP-grasp domain-containing protein n=1 Tax=Clostridia TaxID=186801 RepID=UPI000EA338F8|nr:MULTISPECIES: ATP-grasp domain-containing protein [Clostridia]NBJ69336.1 ATP-grasp domain-containing protein [Roseburia sp. 1XD42-34]RKI79003.1 ATP-grasp domain-containing protein [Clostridium sp. 1xD42-85]